MYVLGLWEGIVGGDIRTTFWFTFANSIKTCGRVKTRDGYCTQMSPVLFSTTSVMYWVKLIRWRCTPSRPMLIDLSGPHTMTWYPPHPPTPYIAFGGLWPKYDIYSRLTVSRVDWCQNICQKLLTYYFMKDVSSCFEDFDGSPEFFFFLEASVWRVLLSHQNNHRSLGSKSSDRE